MTEIAQTGRTDTALPRSDRWRRAFFRFRQSRLSMIGAAMVTRAIRAPSISTR